jgi:NADPH:quinone reductase
LSISSKELRSEITPAGQLRLSLAEREVAPPGPDDVVVRVEAAPINPADMAELLGPADVATLMSEATADRPVTTADVPPRLLPITAGHIGKSLAVGLEGAEGSSER